MKKKNKKHGLNWNAEKHDINAAQRLLEEQKVAAEQQRRVVMLAINRRWQRFKKKDIKKCKNDLEMVTLLQQVRDEVSDLANKNGLTDWASNTTSLINAKIDQINRGGTAPINIIYPAFPPAEGEKVKFAEVRSYEEILKLPWVAPATLSDGFIGLVREGDILWAFHKDGELVKVARCTNAVGVAKLPTKAEVEEEIAKHKAKNN